MKSLVVGGSTTRSACGMMMWRRACQRVMPSANAASICACGMAWMPAR